MGIEIDIEKGQMSIPEQKLSEILEVCKNWQSKVHANKRQLQSLIGKLLFVHKCVRPARLFVNRMLEVLKSAPEVGKVHLSSAFSKDLNWFVFFATV